MAKGRTLTLYKAAIEELGLRQLDVYRIVKKDENKMVDVIRIFDPATNKVVLVELPSIREALDPKDYIDILLDSLAKAGVSYPERKAAQLRDLFYKLSQEKGEEAVQEAAQ